MSTIAVPPIHLQLKMPGMPMPVRPAAGEALRDVRPGKEVQYLGRVSGGPRFGAKGVVKETKGRRALVDLGRAGTWLVPYFFLGIPLSARPGGV